MSHATTGETAAAAHPRHYRNDPYAQLPDAKGALLSDCDDDDNNNNHDSHHLAATTAHDDVAASEQLNEASARDVRVGDTIAYECMTPHRNWRVALGTVLAMPSAQILHVQRYDAVNAIALARDPDTEAQLRATAERCGRLDVWHDREALAAELTRVAAQEYVTATRLFAARLQTRQKRDDAEARMAATIEALDAARTNLHTVPARQWRDARTRSDVPTDIQRLLQAVLLVLKDDANTTSLAAMQAVLRQPEFAQRLLACDCSEKPLSRERRRRIVQLCEPELPPTPAAAAAAAAAKQKAGKAKATATAAAAAAKTKKPRARSTTADASGARRASQPQPQQPRRRRSSAASTTGSSSAAGGGRSMCVPDAGEAVGTMATLDAVLRRWINAQFACAHATLQRERAMQECFAELQEQRVQLSATNDLRIHMSRLQEQMREVRLTIEHGDDDAEVTAAAITATQQQQQQHESSSSMMLLPPATHEAGSAAAAAATAAATAGQLVAMRDGGEPPVAPLESLPVDHTFYRATATEAFCLRQQMLVNFGVVACDAGGYIRLTPTQATALRNVSYQSNVQHDAVEMTQLLEQKAREEAELKDLHELLHELASRHTRLPHDEDEMAQLRQLIADVEHRHETTLTRIADLYAAGRGAREITLAGRRAAHTFTRLHCKMSGDWTSLTSEPVALSALKQALYRDLMRILHIPIENISHLELRCGSLEAYFTVRHSGELDAKALQELIDHDTFATLSAFYESVTFKKTYPLNTSAQQRAYDRMCRVNERMRQLPVSGKGVTQLAEDFGTLHEGGSSEAGSEAGSDAATMDMSEYYSAEVRGDAAYCATRVTVPAMREDYDDMLVSLKDEYMVQFEELPRVCEDDEQDDEQDAPPMAVLLADKPHAEAAAGAHDDDANGGGVDHVIVRGDETTAMATSGVPQGLTQTAVTDDDNAGHAHTQTMMMMTAAATADVASAHESHTAAAPPPASPPLSEAAADAPAMSGEAAIEQMAIRVATSDVSAASATAAEAATDGHDEAAVIVVPTDAAVSAAAAPPLQEMDGAASQHGSDTPRALTPAEEAAAISAAAAATPSQHSTPRAAAAAAATPRQATPCNIASKPMTPAEEHAKHHEEAAADENAAAMMQQQEHEHAGHDIRPPTPPLQPQSSQHGSDTPRALTPAEEAAAVSAAAAATPSQHSTPRAAAAAATPRQATPCNISSKPMTPAEEHAKHHEEAAADENAAAMMQQQEHEHAGHDIRPPTPPLQPQSSQHGSDTPRALTPAEEAAAISAAAAATPSQHSTPRAAAAAAATPRQATPCNIASKPMTPAEEHAKHHEEAAADENAAAMMQQQEHEHAGHDIRPPTPPLQPQSSQHGSDTPSAAAAAVVHATVPSIEDDDESEGRREL